MIDKSLLLDRISGSLSVHLRDSELHLGVPSVAEDATNRFAEDRGAYRAVV